MPVKLLLLRFNNIGMDLVLWISGILSSSYSLVKTLFLSIGSSKGGLVLSDNTQ